MASAGYRPPVGPPANLCRWEKRGRKWQDWDSNSSSSKRNEGDARLLNPCSPAQCDRALRADTVTYQGWWALLLPQAGSRPACARPRRPLTSGPRQPLGNSTRPPDRCGVRLLWPLPAEQFQNNLKCSHLSLSCSSKLAGDSSRSPYLKGFLSQKPVSQRVLLLLSPHSPVSPASFYLGKRLFLPIPLP